MIAFDDRGVRLAPDRPILVYSIEDGGKLVAWGRDGFRHKIDAVQNAGLPFTVECEHRLPNPSMAQDSAMRIGYRKTLACESPDSATLTDNFPCRYDARLANPR